MVVIRQGSLTCETLAFKMNTIMRGYLSNMEL